MFPLAVIVRSCLDELLCLVGSADRVKYYRRTDTEDITAAHGTML